MVRIGCSVTLLPPRPIVIFLRPDKKTGPGFLPAPLLFGTHGKPHQNFSKYNLQTGCGSVTNVFEIKIR